MKSILEFFLILTTGFFPPILGSLFHTKYRESFIKFSNSESLVVRWVSGIVPIAAVLFIALNLPGGASSIGLFRGITGNNGSAVATGIIALSIAFVVGFVADKIKRKNKPRKQIPPDLTNPNIEEIARYRKFWERVGYLVVLTFLVIGEDLVSRGYLVLLMGARTHSFIPWILISIGFSVVIHLYQGKTRRNIIIHSLYAIFFIGLTLLTKNLLAAISAHIYYDVLLTISGWRNIDQWNPQGVKLAYSKKERVFLSIFLIINFYLFCGMFFLYQF